MFRRGFKTWCEETALQTRKQMKIAPNAPLDPVQLATFLNIRLRTPEDFPKLPSAIRDRLLGEHSDAWSAFTVNGCNGATIVYNPKHSAARTANNLMHEIAHIILQHKPAKLFINSTGLPIRSHDKDQEDEANWLAGCLLLPRPILLLHGKRGIPAADVCAKFGVSRDLLTFRMNVSGVNYQLRNLRGR